MRGHGSGFVVATWQNVQRLRSLRLKNKVYGQGYLESVKHLASGCSGLAQREYKRRHDRIGLKVY